MRWWLATSTTHHTPANSAATFASPFYLDGGAFADVGLELETDLACRGSVV